MKYTTEFDPQFETRPLSYSSLKAFQKSPQHFVEYRTVKKEQTPAMAFGSVIDCLILTPDEFLGKFVVKPEDLKKPTSAQVGAAKPSQATLEQIKRYDAFCEENKGKTWIDKDDYLLAQFLAEKTFSNAKAKELLGRVVRTQDKISWTDKETGLAMVGYKDATGDTFILDLKTAATGEPDKYLRNAFELGYHIQAGAYLDGEKTLFGKFPDFYHLVIETVAPYNITVFKADEKFIKLGMHQYKELLTEIKYCAENNLWFQGYEFHTSTGYHNLALPAWALNKLDKYK